MTEKIELFCALQFGVIGLSHLLGHRHWKQFFTDLSERPSTAAFVSGMLGLVVGSVIVVFHNVWNDASVVLTLIGWAMTLKGAAWLIFPDLGAKSVANVQFKPSGLFCVAGGFMLGLAIFSFVCAISKSGV